MARNLLRWAAGFDRTSAVKVLLDRPDISPNPRPGNDTSRTALYLAIVNGYHPIVRLLLKRSDIRPNLKYQGQTLLHAAIFYGYKYIAQLLLEHKAVGRNAKNGYHRNSLSAAIWRGRAKIACLILQQPGIDIIWMDCQGCMAASYAAQRGYQGILRALYTHEDTVLDNVDGHSRTFLI